MVSNFERAGRAAGVATALVVGLVLVAACSSGGGGADPDPGEAPPAPEPPFAVGRRTLELVDDSRPTDAYPPASVAAAPDRTIEVHLLYPAEGEAPSETDAEDTTDTAGTTGSATPDAPPAGDGFPLVVWAHGWTGTNEAFLPHAERWAREGYVVALPEFPLSREGIGNSDDVQNQPGDVSFVIDQVLGLDGDDPLAGVADGERVAVGGHSLGAATVFGVAYNTCCLDERIDAAIAVSGGGLIFEGGDYVEEGTVPLLLVHGARDQTVPIGVGDATFRNRPAPVTYLRFGEADHNSLFRDDDDRPVLERAVLAFLDAELRGDPAGMESLPAAVESSGRAVLRTK